MTTQTKISEEVVTILDKMQELLCQSGLDWGDVTTQQLAHSIVSFFTSHTQSAVELFAKRLKSELEIESFYIEGYDLNIGDNTIIYEKGREILLPKSVNEVIDMLVAKLIKGEL